jgi:hypothetical protein
VRPREGLLAPAITLYSLDQCLGISWAQKTADDLLHTTRFKQHGQTGGAVARIIVNDSPLARTLIDSSHNAFIGDDSVAESTNQDSTTIG